VKRANICLPGAPQLLISAGKELWCSDPPGEMGAAKGHLGSPQPPRWPHKVSQQPVSPSATLSRFQMGSGAEKGQGLRGGLTLAGGARLPAPPLGPEPGLLPLHPTQL
jgi:hypothetical protein